MYESNVLVLEDVWMQHTYLMNFYKFSTEVENWQWFIFHFHYRDL